MSSRPERSVEPTRAVAAEDASGKVLTRVQVESWREQGFALVDGVFPETLIARARSEADTRFPAAGSTESEQVSDFGSEGALAFPTEVESINALTLHPRILGAVSELLEQEPSELRLTQSDVWAKYGRKTRVGGDR